MARRSAPAKGPDWSPQKTLPLLKEQLRRLQAFKGKTFREVERLEDEWEQFTRSVIIHGFGEESENIRNFYSARSAGIHNIMGISDHQRQLNFDERISQYEATLNSCIRELEVMVVPAPEVIVVPAPVSNPLTASKIVRPTGAAINSHGDEPLVLISHSSKDVELATALVEFLRAGLLINRIRCSSVDGYRLPAGVHTESQLRAEVNSTSVLIGLITPNSLASAYVMFELGARWGAGSYMIPLLAGLTAEEIRGPLSGLNALSGNNDAQLHQLLGDVANALNTHLQRPESYVGQLTVLKSKASDVKPLGHMPATSPKSRNTYVRRKQVEKEILSMTPKEREIIGYLLANNQKLFTYTRDGGHANTLISKRIVVSALLAGQSATGYGWPFKVPDHVWDVLVKHKAEFPNTWKDGEPFPYAIHWMER